MKISSPALRYDRKCCKNSHKPKFTIALLIRTACCFRILGQTSAFRCQQCLLILFSPIRVTVYLNSIFEMHSLNKQKVKSPKFPSYTNIVRFQCREISLYRNIWVHNWECFWNLILNNAFKRKMNYINYSTRTLFLKMYFSEKTFN